MLDATLGIKAVHLVLGHDQVIPLDQGRTDRGSEQLVLVVSGVVRARCQQDDRRIPGPRCDALKDAPETGRVVVDAAHGAGCEPPGCDVLHRAPRLERVGDATRDAHVVLEHAERPMDSDNVDPRHMAPGGPRGSHADDVAQVPGAAVHETSGDDPLSECALRTVAVRHEVVECDGSLRERAMQRSPLRCADDARNGVEREDRRNAVCGDAEGDLAAREPLLCAPADGRTCR